MFAFFNDKKPLSWVQSQPLAAVSDKAWNSLKGKFIKISLNADGSNPMDVQVVDFCSDKDCGGCCSSNMRNAGVDFLIDLEKFTAAKFLGKTPQQVVKDGLFRNIYYSIPSSAAANAENSATFIQTVPVDQANTNIIIGVSVGAVVLVVVVVVVVVVVLRKREVEETV
jgi:hypothetical protein